MAQQSCPSAAELCSYALGSVDDEQLDRIGDHLDGCASCTDAMTQWDHADDSVVAAIRLPRQEGQAADDEAYRAAAARLDAMIERTRAGSRFGLSGEACDHLSDLASDQEASPGTATVERFLDALETTKLMSADEFRAFQETHFAGLVPSDVRTLAETLVEHGNLTKFQALHVLRGTADSLVFDEYLVIDKIGAGGMGQVYKARHRRMKRLAAIKVLPPAAVRTPDAVRRFQREVEAAAKLIHSNIVIAHDAGQSGNVHYLVMEYIDGQDLASLVKQRGPLPVAEAVDYVTQAARGLVFAHQQGVIHRDIKPANLLLDKHGVVKVLDLGLARLVNAPAVNEGLTQAGQVMGTVDYMAPEQVVDTEKTDARVDIYSLGCTLYRLLTATNLYSGATMMQRFVAHREAPIPDLRARRPDVPQALDAVFRRMVAKQPSDRYSSMAEVLAALDGVRDVVPIGGETTSPAAGNSGIMAAGGNTVSNLSADVPTDPKSAAGRAPPQPTCAKLPTPPASERRTPGPPWRLVAMAAGLCGAAFLAVTVLRLKTPEGTLIVEVDQPDATVEVSDTQDQVRITRQSAHQAPIAISIDPGKHRVKVTKDGFDFFAEEFEIDSGGRRLVKVALVPNQAPPVATATPRATASATVNTAPVPGFQIKFKKHQLDDRYRSEGASVGDFNHDGKLDIAAGTVYYAAPDWKLTKITDKLPDFDPLDYSQSFSNFAEDVSGDGRTDLIVVGPPGKATSWYEQPESPGGLWQRYLITPVTNNESPQLLDIDGDRVRELLLAFRPGRHVGYAQRTANPAAPWKLIAVSATDAPGSEAVSHGLGAGDINGDGRIDILVKQGWWEAPADRGATPWTFHSADLGDDCAQMYVYDFDGDGDADVLSSSAHNVGIWWHEQTPQVWQRHDIDQSFSQTHALALADVNGDGLADFVTGKRWWAHGPTGDPEPDAPAVLLWYELTRQAGRPTWIPHQIDHDSGVGNQFEVRDVNGDGLLDIAVANRKGAFYFEQQRCKAVQPSGALGSGLWFRELAYDAWADQVAAMPAEKQVEAVAQKLQELNPGFDGKLTSRVEQGVVTFVDVRTNQVTDVSPVRALAGLKMLSLYGERLSDLSPLSGMQLRILGCGGSLGITDLSPLRGMPLSQLRCYGTQISDLSPLEGMPLRLLQCSDARISDLAPLRGMSLEELAFDDTQVADLAPLAGMPLRVFSCQGTRVTDLSPLRAAPLQYLNCKRNIIADFSPLAASQSLKSLKAVFTRLTPDGMAALQKALPDCKIEWTPPITTFKKPNFLDWQQGVTRLPAEKQVEAVSKRLQELNPGFDGKMTPKITAGIVTELAFLTRDVTDISPVRALKGLKALDVHTPGGGVGHHGKLADLSPLEGMSLTSLDVSFSHVFDLAPLHGMALDKLRCNDTLVTDLSFAVLEGIPLTCLHCERTHVSDLTPLRGMPLVKLYCHGSRVFSLAPLAGLPLSELNVGNKNISDLSPLAGMKLTSFECYESQVADLAPLRGMPLTLVRCGRTKVSDLSPLRGLPLRELTCQDLPLSDLSPLIDCKQLTQLVVTGCPLTAVDIATLQKCLPNCKIEWYKPAKTPGPTPAQALPQPGGPQAG